MRTSTLHTPTGTRTTTLLRTGTPLALALLCGLASPTAQAATVNNRICVDWDIGFTDQWTLEDETGLGPPDDIWATDDDVPATGLMYYVYEISGGTTNLIDWSYLGGPGTNSGCTTSYALDTTKRYSFVALSAAVVADDLVQMLASTQDPRMMSMVGFLSLPPLIPTPINPTGTRNLRLRNATWSDTLAAAAKTVERFAPTVSQTFVVYPWGMDPADPGVTRLDGGGMPWSHEGKAYIPPHSRSKRYTVAHEIGHSIVHLVTGAGIPNDDSFDNPGGELFTSCPTTPSGHSSGTVEYASIAMSEGWADFVAVSTWNLITEPDCWYYSGGALDWNGDQAYDDYSLALQGSAEDPFPEMLEWQDCEGDTEGRMHPDPDFFAGGDFIGNTCALHGVPALGNQMDWRRMFWDMATEGGSTRNQLLSVIAQAKSVPGCWETGLTASTTCGPNARMAMGAFSVGGSTLWATWMAEAVYNGVEP